MIKNNYCVALHYLDKNDAAYEVACKLVEDNPDEAFYSIKKARLATMIGENDEGYSLAKELHIADSDNYYILIGYVEACLKFNRYSKAEEAKNALDNYKQPADSSPLHIKYLKLKMRVEKHFKSFPEMSLDDLMAKLTISSLFETDNDLTKKAQFTDLAGDTEVDLFSQAQ